MLYAQRGSVFWSYQFVVMGQAIGTLFTRALQKGLVSWMISAQDERQQLDSRGNCAGGMYCLCRGFFYLYVYNMFLLNQIQIKI